jgi:DNA-dependent protein kinase catalytic subunit
MPRTEDIYLLYATCMVLNNTKKSADFEQPIFNEPLPHARFDADYQHINTSWQTTSSMMPLFKSTQTQVVSSMFTN